ncbi:zinc metalloprotease [Segetibacter sp. 3557_3]|uniref:zinc metalloprotease n=1 Tax=Segetibacter sp. 3557_3 TaxID=2547429 RepID=UPI0010585D84|nr:zinc metalloprotease [Segetibacter sp. 3557_3]TDH19737.1 zinc metalloprotease [Segetibacter sp. 3557_3]
MRKFSTPLIGLIFLAVSCSKQDAKTTLEQQQPQETIAALPERRCASQEVLEQQLATDPSLRKRMADIEAHTQKVVKNRGNLRAAGGRIEIPVIVHVVYNTAAENISDQQVNSQIAVLNEDFNNRNADRVTVPVEFQDEQTSVGVQFVLDRIIRVQTSKKRFSYYADDVKKATTGGSNPVEPTRYLNMWACNLGQNLLGYAQFPGGAPETDGVVVLYSAFGSQSKTSGSYIANYNLGRTATHEVGHWLNLRHIWGDATCGNDLVDDTPQHNTSNGGCPSYPHLSTCAGNPVEMTMNYMDYTYDGCMNMFSNGQRDRMLATFTSGGPRAAYAK